MKTNNINLPPNVAIQPFKNGIIDNFKHNLTSKLCSSVAKLLAIDYAIRLQTKLPVAEHFNNCISRLRNFLGYRIVAEEDFASSMTLFTVAISPEIDTNNSKSSITQQSQDAAIDAIISSHFGEISAEEQIALKTIIKELLIGQDNKEIVNFINSDPKIFYSIILTAFKSKKNQQEIAQIAHLNINDIVTKSKKIDKKINKIKAISSQVSIFGAIIATATIGMFTGGLALPIIIAPLALASIKMSPALGQKIANIAISSNQDIKLQKAGLQELKNTFTDIEHSKTNPVSSSINKEKTHIMAKNLPSKDLPKVDKLADKSALVKNKNNNSRGI